MIAERPSAGFLILIAAGITVLVGAFMPWAQLTQPPVRFTALQMHLYGPFVVAIVTGLLLIGLALARTMWAAGVGLVSAFVMGMLTLAIHLDVYAGLRVAAPSLQYGDVSHLTGFGVSVFLAGGLMAAAGGFITVVQIQPKVDTSRNPATSGEWTASAEDSEIAVVEPDAGPRASSGAG